MKEQNVTKANQLYLATCIYKGLNHKYSWGNSISGSKIKSDKFSLPTKDGKPDYATMETLIKAVEKLVIKDVVLYADSKIEAAKNVVGYDVIKYKDDALKSHPNYSFESYNSCDMVAETMPPNE